MSDHFIKQKDVEKQKGAVLIWVAAGMIAFLGFAALAIDVGFLMASRNELQNAADAGALAGARDLYNENGTAINQGANQVAYDIAIKNLSMNEAVEVNWTGGNNGDVQRGHWSFATRTFTPNASLEPVDLWNVSDETLDADTNFINAVRVKTRRESTPVSSFFARVFGNEGSVVTADAVAYIGFAGTMEPTELDQPVAICDTSITNALDEYTCDVGRMLNSGQNEDSETGAWTNLDHDCSGGTNNPELNAITCASGNINQLFFGQGIATINGVVNDVYMSLYDCWEANTGKTVSWEITLPVIECPETGPVTTTCGLLIGAVKVNVVWMTGSGEDPQYNNAPETVDDWSAATAEDVSDPSDGEQRWDSFVTHFNLETNEYKKKTIYFLPDCKYHEPKGRSGGRNFGILAKIPSLVE